MILFVNVDIAGAQTGDIENNNLISLTHNDLWDLIVPGIYLSQGIAWTEKEQLFYPSSLKWGYSDRASIKLKLIPVQNRNISEISYTPLIELTARPFSFLELKVNYEKPNCTLIIPSGKNSLMQSDEKIRFTSTPQWIYQVLMEIPDKKDNNGHVLTDLFYHFQDNIFLFYLGRNTFFLKTYYTPSSRNTVTTDFHYTILSGADQFTVAMPTTRNTSNEMNLSLIAATRTGLALMGEVKKREFEQEVQLQSVQTRYQTLSTYSLGNSCLRLIYAINASELILLTYNRFETKFKQLDEYSGYDHTSFTTDQIGLKTLNVFTPHSHTLAEIKNNRDNYFGSFPFPEEKVIETNLVYSTQEKLLQMLAELKYGLYNNLYLRFGFVTNYIVINSFTNGSSFFTYGLGFRNYSPEDGNFPERTDRTDMLGRVLPAWNYHFEIRSFRDINDTKLIWRRHQFDAYIGLPWGINLHLQRKVTDFWSQTELMQNFPFIMDLSPYLEYYSWIPVQYTNQVELKRFMLPDLVGSLQFIYDETNYIEPDKFTKGHEVFGDYRFVFSLAFYYH